MNKAKLNRPRVSVFLGISMDGFIAGAGGDLSWLSIAHTDPPEDTGYNALMRVTDVLVLGRNTYEAVLNFEKWPYAAKRVLVLTHRTIESRHGEEAFNGTLTDLLEQLGAEGHHHVYLDGGCAVREGLKSGVVDELTMSRIPIVLGTGIPLFTAEVPMSKWQLEASCVFSSGLVQGRYVPRS